MEIQGAAPQGTSPVETEVAIATGQDELTIDPEGPLTASPSATAAPDPASNKPLTDAVAKLLGSGDAQVSYRVYRNPDQIVTVFTDPHTGQEIAQFPSETMVQLAEFFDAQSGVTVDQNA